MLTVGKLKEARLHFNFLRTRHRSGELGTRYRAGSLRSSTWIPRSERNKAEQERGLAAATHGPIT